MYQYHMIQIVLRHLTAKPNLEASVELLAISVAIIAAVKINFNIMNLICFATFVAEFNLLPAY